MEFNFSSYKEIGIFKKLIFFYQELFDKSLFSIKDDFDEHNLIHGIKVSRKSILINIFFYLIKLIEEIYHLTRIIQ